MSRLIQLYPREWRARYGGELEALLEARPPSLLDRLDLLRGALDARLHPELVTRDAARPEERLPGARSAGLLVALGAALWMFAVVSVAAQPILLDGRDARVLSLLAIGGFIVATGFAQPHWAAGSAGRGASAALAASSLVLLPMVWPVAPLAFYGMLVTLGVFAYNRASAGAWPVWLSGATIVSAIAAFGTNTETAAMWLAIGPGVCLLALGLLTALEWLPVPPPQRVSAEALS